MTKESCKKCWWILCAQKSDQRGYIAGKTNDEQNLIDVIAKDKTTLKTVNIKVKTTFEGSRPLEWIMSKKMNSLLKIFGKY